MLYPLLFHNNFVDKVWGGTDIKSLKGLTPDGEPVGESWEVSTVESAPSVVANGPYFSRRLEDLIHIYGADLVGTRVHAASASTFPLLIKFISAAGDLSIQVHPNDYLALSRHQQMGKSEMWYVIDCQPGAYLYSGFSRPVTPEEYERRVADGTITEVLRRHEVRPGDAFYIPAGRIHAICSGILLAEIQENSDVTYRIYDYNRPGLDGRPRQLHTELALNAIDYDNLEPLAYHIDAAPNRRTPIVENHFFRVGTLPLTQEITVERPERESFIIYMCFKGSVRLTAEGVDGPLSTAVIEQGNSCLVPAAITRFHLSPLTPEAQLVTAEM